MFVLNKMFTTNKISSIESDNWLIEKCKKLLKTEKLSKLKIQKARNYLSFKNWLN